MHKTKLISKPKSQGSGLTIVRSATILLLVITILSLASGQSIAENAPASANLLIQAPDHINLGGAIDITFKLDGNVQVGGFEAEVLYDRSAGEFAAFSPLAPQGNEGLGELAAPELPSGSAVGFYTCGTEPCLQTKDVQVQAAAAAGNLAQVELLGLQAGQLQVKIDHIQLVDRSGHPIQVTIPQNTITVQVGDGGQLHAAPASTWAWAAKSAQAVTATVADVTQDGQVSHSDIMDVAMAWESEREQGKPCGGSEPAADINSDGCVDVADVQTAAALAAGDITPEVPNFPDHLFLPQLRGSDSEAAVAEAVAVLTLTVNTNSDEWDTKIGDGICKTPSNTCSLRAAIYEVNAHPGPDTILFNIPGNGVQTIQLLNKLPTLSDSAGGTFINGYSQPGSAPNTDPLVDDAQVRIQLRGDGYENFDGLPISSSDNVIQGLALFNVKRPFWIYGAGAHDNVIAGDFIGTDALGTAHATAISDLQAHGVHMEQGTYNNLIGGVQPASRNVIGGNARSGVGLWHAGTNGNQIFNNLIGLSPDGKHNLGNRLHGIDLNYGASYNIVGGTGPGQRNVISGDGGKGVEFSHTSQTSHNDVIGNYIGTDVTGTSGPSYAAIASYGVSVKDRVSYNRVLNNVIANTNGGIVIDNFGNCCTVWTTVQNNRIGVGVNGEVIPNLQFGIWITAPDSIIGPRNIIANNPIGIKIEGEANDKNSISRNSIYANTGLGIDLAPIGQVNANDPDDMDSGPNQQLNFPVLLSATTTQVTGTTCANCTVEIFIADSGAGAYGEGKTFIGSVKATDSGAFTAAISGTVPGDYLTATATDNDGNTSEFSLNLVVSGPTPPPPALVTPSRLEAENYRLGGSGVAYFDTTAGNSGHIYRNDDVDIEVTQDVSGSYDIGWIATGEWLTYDITASATATYAVSIRVATPNINRTVHLEIDGNNVSGPIAIPWTGSFQTWKNATAKISIPAGPHVLRLVADTDKFNFNYIDITASP